MKFYDMEGKALPMVWWAKRFEQIEGRRIGRTKVWPGWTVSTVLVGIDMSFGLGPPKIFETMVFHPGTGGLEAAVERYSTKEEALQGHRRMVRRFRWMVVQSLVLYLRSWIGEGGERWRSSRWGRGKR